MGFFEKFLPHKAMPTELSEIHARLDAEMQGLTREWALESLGVERLLPLLNIADHEGHNEALKMKIIDIVQSVDETWLLSLILRSIKCVTE